MNSETDAGRDSAQLEMGTEMAHRNARRAKTYFACSALWLVIAIGSLVRGIFKRDIAGLCVGIGIGIGALVASAMYLRTGLLWKNPNVRIVYESLRYPNRLTPP
jgi:hypothetical protein